MDAKEHGTWVGTHLKARCLACGTSPLDLQQRLGVQPAQLRLPLHSGTLVPCGASYQEVLLVPAEMLQRIRDDAPVTTDERVQGYYEGRRSACERIAEAGAALLRLVLAALVLVTPGVALASEGVIVSVLGAELIVIGCALGLVVTGALAGVYVVLRWLAAQQRVVVYSSAGAWWFPRLPERVEWGGEQGPRWRHQGAALARRSFVAALVTHWRLPVALLVLSLTGCGGDDTAAVHRGLDWLLLVGCGVFGGMWAHLRDRVHDLEQVRDVLQGEVVTARRQAQLAHLRADAAESVLQVMAGQAGGVQ